MARYKPYNVMHKRRMTGMFLEKFTDVVLSNTYFRKVLQTGSYGQVVAMCLPPSEDIGQETHMTTDQIFLFVEGTGEVSVAGETKAVTANDMLFVTAGALHNITNTGTNDLKLLTIYCPPNHPDGTVHATKADAVAAEGDENVDNAEAASTVLDGALPDWESTP